MFELPEIKLWRDKWAVKYTWINISNEDVYKLTPNFFTILDIENLIVAKKGSALG